MNRIDILVAKAIMDEDIIHKYSSNMEHAWGVVQRMHLLGFSYCIEQVESEDKPTVWFVVRGERAPVTVVHETEHISEKSDSLPEAICLAALSAIKRYGLPSRHD